MDVRPLLLFAKEGRKGGRIEERKVERKEGRISRKEGRWEERASRKEGRKE
jgi:hypothetical protein